MGGCDCGPRDERTLTVGARLVERLLGPYVVRLCFSSAQALPGAPNLDPADPSTLDVTISGRNHNGCFCGFR